MEKLTFFDVSYEKNHTIAPQGNRDSISKYLRNGYYVVYEQNGFWILNKSSRVMVYLKDTKGNEHAVDNENQTNTFLRHHYRLYIDKSRGDGIVRQV